MKRPLPKEAARRDGSRRKPGRPAPKRKPQALHSDVEKAEILAAAEELGSVGTLRVAERLKRETEAERRFVERHNALLARMTADEAKLERGSPALREHRRKATDASFMVLLELAQESVKKGYPNSSVSPVEILESPSFRDSLGHLIAQHLETGRQTDSPGQWPGHRIADALFGKSMGGDPGLPLAEALADQLDLEESVALRDALERVDKQIPKELVSESEIEKELIRLNFRLKPPRAPGPRPLPAAYEERWADAFNARYLPQLAHQLSEFRFEPRRGRPSYRKRAMKWMRENKPNRRPKKLKTLQRSAARRRLKET